MANLQLPFNPKDYDLVLYSPRQINEIEEYIIIRGLRMKAMGCSDTFIKEWQNSIKRVALFSPKTNQLTEVTRNVP